ncbi:MAG TPA: 4Fe-4S dicluster domain-containing protein [Anaerolineae bacterium]|jgi:Fe-S-cluster-containing dehydrogenase component|nr:4Fe-4S dicluster domain-containing protein [Anaerolineae bacterium]
MMDTLNIDAEKCTTCMACELACSFAHEGAFVPTLSRIRVVRFMGEGLSVPIVCVNCARPACVEVCPSGAAYIDRTVPVVRVNEEDCIGCGECVKACPFGAADFNKEKEVALICDLCDGDPVCVEHCIYGALTFEPVQSLAQRKRRVTAEAYAQRDKVS